MAADRIKKLQGKEVTEKPLDYWTDKKKEDEDIEVKEALIKKYVTTPKTAPVTETKSTGLSRGRLSLFIFVVAAFFVGTGYGIYVISMPSNNSAVAMTVNDSAFPAANNTTANKTNTTTTKSTTAVTTTKNTTPSTTKTTTSTKTIISNNSNNSKKSTSKPTTNST